MIDWIHELIMASKKEDSDLRALTLRMHATGLRRKDIYTYYNIAMNDLKNKEQWDRLADEADVIWGWCLPERLIPELQGDPCLTNKSFSKEELKAFYGK